MTGHNDRTCVFGSQVVKLRIFYCLPQIGILDVIPNGHAFAQSQGLISVLFLLIILCPNGLAVRQDHLHAWGFHWEIPSPAAMEKPSEGTTCIILFHRRMVISSCAYVNNIQLFRLMADYNISQRNYPTPKNGGTAGGIPSKRMCDLMDEVILT